MADRSQLAAQFCSRKKRQRKTITFLFGAWNVRTLTDDDNCNEIKTTIVARFLCQHDNFVSLSETRLADELQLMEVGASYTF